MWQLMPAIHVDWTLNFGQIVLGLLLTGIGWGLRRGYFMARDFMRRQNVNEGDLHRGLMMIDRHTMALRRAALMGPPATRVFRRRQDDAGELDILDDPGTVS